MARLPPLGVVVPFPVRGRAMDLSLLTQLSKKIFDLGTAVPVSLIRRLACKRAQKYGVAEGHQNRFAPSHRRERIAKEEDSVLDANHAAMIRLLPHH